MPKTVLIIEDEPKNLKLLHDLLRQFGYETLEATDGEKGVELTRAYRPDLVLMDVMMPKLDGLEATRILKGDAGTRDIPVIAVTSNAMTGDRERALTAGCDAYISKPLNIRDLLGTVGRFLPPPASGVKMPAASAARRENG